MKEFIQKLILNCTPIWAVGFFVIGFALGQALSFAHKTNQNEVIMKYKLDENGFLRLESIENGTHIKIQTTDNGIKTIP